MPPSSLSGSHSSRPILLVDIKRNRKKRIKSEERKLYPYLLMYRCISAVTWMDFRWRASLARAQRRGASEEFDVAKRVEKLCKN